MEIEAGIVGGDGDGGVDGFYLFVNRKFIREDTDITLFKGQELNIELIILQATCKASFEESVPEKLEHFVEYCLRLKANIQQDQELLYSESLLTLVKLFHTIYRSALSSRPKLLIRFFHVSLGDKIDKKVRIKSELLKRKVSDFFTISECSYTFLGGKDLIKLYNQQPERQLSLPTQKHFGYKSFGKSAYICVATLPEFFDFITENNELREYIFEANVRDHAPDYKVNKGIRATLAEPEGDDFWWLNNGITIVASRVFCDNDVLQITDPLIVNGLQTSHEVYRHFTDRGSKGDKRTTMVKVIENSDGDVSDRIISATNSQTKIPPINLHATEQIHRQIEMALKTVGLFYDRRKNFYRNKGEPADKIITISYMAQAVAAVVLQAPDHARARPSTVAEKNYDSLFSEAYDFSMYVKCAQIMKRVDSFLDELNTPQGVKLNLIFYLAMHATCAALKSTKPPRATIASLELSLLTDALLKQCHDWLFKKFADLGFNDRAAKGPDLTTVLKQHLVEEYGRGRTRRRPRSAP
jgi:hypothetical protein